ncbi:hypothetical protein BJ508DRAFT_332423 [Ascobolus immersus RN42]|uniref:Hypervirulence associated protein TUDOR domain-containing protein n=1 Tax=Ascobolus immersus RN42 TaxID=1160509 RepID=A0A3N4HTL4_ASCIM|nr:hypothetical protein BJ508DRAFT_332423 [Ascobolus immersus RN42]
MVHYKTVKVAVESEDSTPEASTPISTTARQTKKPSNSSTASETADEQAAPTAHQSRQTSHSTHQTHTSTSHHTSSGRDQAPKQQSADHNSSGEPYEPLPTHEKMTGGASASKLHQLDPDKITEEGDPDRNVFKEDIHNIPFREGQTVEYVPIGGPNSHTSMSTGRIERVLTSKAQAGDKNVRVNATKDQPQYEILNDNTQKRTALKGKNLINVIDDPQS